MRSSTPILTAPLLANSSYSREKELETGAVQAGIRRYHQLAAEAVGRGEGAMLKPAERLLLYWFEGLREGILEEQRSIRAGHADQGRSVYGPLVAYGTADEIAVIALQEVISICMADKGRTGVPLASLAYTIGRAMVAEASLKLLKKENHDVYETLTQKFRSLSPGRVNLWAKKHLTEPIWSRRVCTHAGTCLVWLIIGHCVLPTPDDKGNARVAFRHGRKWSEGKGTATITMDDEVYQIIEDGHDVRALMRPRYLPMVVEPLPWTYIEDDKGRRTVQGGYLQIRTPFISKPTPTQKAALEGADLTSQFAATTDVSSTPLRVNRRIHEVMLACYEAGGGIGHMPTTIDVPKPPRPDAFEDEKAEKAWKREAVKVRRENIQLACDRSEFAQKLGVATDFVNEPAIWFPHQLDFRGRGYPIPVHLNHQGDDVCRGLLEFSEGKEADARARWNIKVHAANCWGLDKVPFSARVRWVDDNAALIKGAAKQPEDSEWWHKAEKPWQFLAAVMALHDDEQAANLAWQCDGTCNGLQHYAAMGRDSRAAGVVNLAPADAPGDVYTDVLRAVAAIVNADDSREARIVAPLLNRKIVKQPTMTSVYGVTMIGAKDQVLEVLKKAGLDGDDLYKCSQYLSRVTLGAIGTVCHSASEIMAWIRQCAERIVETGKPVEWVSPLGLPVVQPYRNWRTFRISTIMGDVILTADDESVPIKKVRQINGTAPNFVHSIDAAHMYATATACRKAGLAFMGVHDSYWTHAATADEMGHLLRREFVKLHREPLLENLRNEWNKRYDLWLPDPPARGDFDINDVMHSPYFFS